MRGATIPCYPGPQVGWSANVEYDAHKVENADVRQALFKCGDLCHCRPPE